MFRVHNKGKEVYYKYDAHAKHRPRVCTRELRHLLGVDNLCRERGQKQDARNKREDIYNLK